MYAPRPMFWSCAAPLPDAALAGFGWDGADLLIGDAGGRGGEMPWGADGCHLLCRAATEAGQGHVIATDGRGFARLFLYRSGPRWAVSNSYSTLVERIAGQGWPLTVQPWALAAWLRPETGFDQLPWSVTAAAEIRFLPNWQAVFIARDGKARIIDRPERASLPGGLDGALQLWLSRLLTILTEPRLALTMELTGGLDSRTCLGLALHLRHSGQLADFGAIRFVSALHQAEDLAVAQHLAGAYGLELNGPQDRQGWVTLPAPERYRMWRDWSLGMFSAPYLPAAQQDPRAIILGGHGSEYLRGLPWSLPRKALLRLALDAPGWRGKWAFRQALAAAWRDAEGQFAPGVDPALKYRWAYRLRQISGHHAQMALRMAPLAGMDFGAWAGGRPANVLAGGRLQFEIMQRLMPGLAAHPFENPAYQMPEGIPAGGPMIPATPGRAFGLQDAAPVPEPQDAGTLAALFAAELQRAKAAGAAGLIGDRTLTAAEALVASQPATPARAAFRPLHASLLAGVLAGAARR